MSSANRLSALALSLALTWMTGCCVGPLACGPKACGPIAVGDPCGGCGQCDGCGELYIDPWINHPPDCCDPCDTCGNFNNQSCGKCRSVFAGVKTIWGYRCDDGCDSCGEAQCGCDAAPACEPACGCDSCVQQEASCGIEIDASCGTETMHMGGIPMANDRAIRIMPAPTTAQAITTTKPGLRTYPQGTPRIFKARPDVARGDKIDGSF